MKNNRGMMLGFRCQPNLQDQAYFSGIADKIARSALFTSSEFLKTLATSGSKVTVIFISFT
jgi:hypothetical protein